jgi:hypothetical protein
VDQPNLSPRHRQTRLPLAPRRACHPTPPTAPGQVPSSYRLFEGKTHTDFLLEDAFRGGKDQLTDSILQLVTGVPQEGRHACMCPRLLVWLASRVCPF